MSKIGPLVTVLLALGLVGPAAAMTSPREARAYAQALRDHGLDPEEYPDPLAWDAAMQRAARDLAGSGSHLERLRRLQVALFDPERFPFSYDYHGTLTAREAFQQRRGNCVTSTILFIALARSIGIPVGAAIPRYGRGSRRESQLVLANSHVVASYRYYRGVSIFDFERSGTLNPVEVQRLSDQLVRAIYLNNHAAELLRDGALDAALQHLGAARALAPQFVEAWNNTGVALRRKGELDAAFDAYETALELDPDNPSVLNNVAALLKLRGDDGGALAALAAADLATATLFSKLVHGEVALRRGNLRRALRLFRQAHREDRSLAEPLVAIARAQLRLGRDARARDAIDDALERDPANEAARRLRDELSSSDDER